MLYQNRNDGMDADQPHADEVLDKAQDVATLAALRRVNSRRACGKR